MKRSLNDEEVMHLALELARHGGRNVSPNPMVGCVIVRDGKIIGQGYHMRFGEAHAEVNAIKNAGGDVAGAEVFVNLEPCSFYGKTPPCVDLLIEKKVKRVVIGMLDPNPRVNGEGVRKLNQAGIETSVGVLQEEAKKLNEAFIKYITRNKPFVVLKIAASVDGKVALENGKSKYITSMESLKRVHELRAKYDAVLVGAGTIIKDNPALTVRYAGGVNPIRVVVDGLLKSPLNSKIFNDRAARTLIVFSSSLKKDPQRQNKLNWLRKHEIELIGIQSDVKGRISLKRILSKLAKKNIGSVLVEGGVDVFSSFLKAREWDRIMVFMAPKILGAGRTFSDGITISDLGSAIKIYNIETENVGVDLLLAGYREKI
ncbi:MAG: bifunctional diaminohydroxyphosphoribosylaminopyrimidine deaminase/5-amino-6-(5-phosphoribosylamino)uracil reductase RibD [Candidatus Kryptoniota bacterium]